MMKYLRTLGAAVLTVCLTVSASFAAPGAASGENSGTPKEKGQISKKDCKDFKGHKFGTHKGFKGLEGKDPVKAAEKAKERIKAKLDEGKITREKADEMNARIDEKAKEMEKFNSLPLAEKKAKLTADFKASVEKRVTDGKMTRGQADEAIKKFTEKIEKWDGKGYPKFHLKGKGAHKKPSSGESK